jgi:hypothetical protein
MLWPYPAENQNPWFDSFRDLVFSIDNSCLSLREDRGIILLEGGTVSWDAGTSTLQWTGAIKIISPLVGYLLQITSDSVSMDDGQFLYAVLVRAPLAGQVLSIGVAAQVPSDDNAFVLAVRYGTKIYWRTGLCLDSGDSSVGVVPSGSGNYWGKFAVFEDLPNSVGAVVQDAALLEGATAYCVADQIMCQCIDATLGAAVWERLQFLNFWGIFATGADLPNVAGSATQRADLQVGATAYVSADLTAYQCIDATLGAAVWSMMGGGGGGAGSYVDLGGHYVYTQALVPVEEVVGHGSFNGDLVGTGDVYFKASITNVFSVIGIGEVTKIRLYDMGPAGGPLDLVPRLVTELEGTEQGGPLSIEVQLTVVSATPGAEEILDEDRMYEIAVIQDATLGDIGFIGSVRFEVG